MELRVLDAIEIGHAGTDYRPNPDHVPHDAREPAQDRAGKHRDEDEPGQPALRVPADRSVSDGGQPRQEQRHQIGPEVDEQRDQGAHVEHHVKRVGVDERVIPAEDARHQDQVRRRADGNELGESLDQTDEGRLQDEGHRMERGFGG